MNQRILFFDDNLRFSGVSDEKIRLLAEGVMQCVDKNTFNPVMVNSQECLLNMIQNLEKQGLTSFSGILDLTGYMEHFMKTLFPNVPIFSDLHLSRLRKISPGLDGIGFISSLSICESQKIELGEKPLIFDDVCWSGRTIEEVIKLLKLNGRNTTIGLFVGNMGEFGEGKPGGVARLKDLGSVVVSGLDVFTPLDDGFHLSDFILDPAIFSLVIKAQRLRETGEIDLLNSLLKENVNSLFPHSLSLEEVKRLFEEDRVIIKSGLPKKESFFCINPTNWLLRSFSMRTTADILEGRRTDLENLFNLFFECREDRVNLEQINYRRAERF